MIFPSPAGIRRTLVGILLIPLLLVSACKSTHYELDLHPQEDKVQRQLKTWVSSRKEGEFGTLDQETIGRIAAEYQASVPEELNIELEFSAAFGPKMPQDIGGAGWYNYWPSSMGALYSYVEQFGGNENLAIGLDRGMLAIDRLILVLTLWLEAEFDDARDLEQITAALNNEIRADLRNIFLLTWLEEASPNGVFDDEELLLRLAQYVLNHGYFNPADMPQLYRAMAELDDENDELLLALIIRGFAARMDVAAEDALPPSLDALGKDWKSYAKSFEEFVESSEEIRILANEWAAEDGSNVGLDKESKIDLDSLTDLFLLVDLFPTGSRSSLNVTLHLPRKPFETNGDWNDEEGVVAWSERIADDEDAIELPASLFAFWVVPAADFQEQRFGTIVIDGEDLVEYALWSNSLSLKQRTEWEMLLEGLDAESDAVDELRNFRFGDDKEGLGTHYDGIRDLFIQLRNSPDEADETKVE